MTQSQSTVFIVDDDPGVLKALSRLISVFGYQTESYPSPREFLDHHDASVPGCALFDVSMPDFDGLELQEALAAAGIQRPVIFITGHGDVATTVRAMKAGAVDVLTKPVEERGLMEAIARAATHDANTRKRNDELSSIQARLALLTSREYEVLTHVIAGRLNKQIAGRLGIVEKTIKVHRSRMMAKMGVRNIVDLVRVAERANIPPAV